MSESSSQAAVCGAAARSSIPPQYSVFQPFAGALNALLGLVERQRQRRALGSLNEHQLRDIGISAAEARHAAAKPFWQ
jgi:uncharacterized protein YjiS (DUF1127 family)